MQFEEVRDWVWNEATQEDLGRLNKLVVEQYKTLIQKLTTSFEIGQEVEFEISGKLKKEFNGKWSGKIKALKKRQVVVSAQIFITTKRGTKTKYCEWSLSPSKIRLKGEQEHGPRSESNEGNIASTT